MALQFHFRMSRAEAEALTLDEMGVYVSFLEKRDDAERAARGR